MGVAPLLDWLFPTDDIPTSQRRPLLLGDGLSVDVLWVRHAQARRMKLSVNERGARLTLPLRASERSAERFLMAHRAWLQEQLRRSGGDLRHPSLQPFRTAQLPLHGARLPLRWHEAKLARIEQDDDGLCFHAPGGLNDARARAVLEDFYRALTRRAIGLHWSRLASGFPIAPRGFKSRLMSSLWGSLSVNNDVTLDLSLALARPSALEYVLVHELCHLLHRDHSPRFWREVQARFPTWEDERDHLHGHGLALKAEARALLR